MNCPFTDPAMYSEDCLAGETPALHSTLPHYMNLYQLNWENKLRKQKGLPPLQWPIDDTATNKKLEEALCNIQYFVFQLEFIRLTCHATPAVGAKTPIRN